MRHWGNGRHTDGDSDDWVTRDELARVVESIMASIQDALTAVAALDAKLDAAVGRVAAEEAAETVAADTQPVIDAVAAVGVKVDAVAPAAVPAP
jgi:hypothetical protein